jgi:hypothetical protein
MLGCFYMHNAGKALLLRNMPCQQYVYTTTGSTSSCLLFFCLVLPCFATTTAGAAAGADANLALAAA